MFKLFTSMILVLFLAVSCQQGGNDTADTSAGNTATEQTDKKILAKVNGVPVYEEDIRNTTINKAIRDEMIYQEGLHLGYDKLFEEKIENFKRNLISNKVKTDVIRDYLKNNPVSEEKLEEVLKEKEDEYTDLILGKISTSDEQLANKILEKAKATGDLEKAATEMNNKDIKYKEVTRSKSFASFLNNIEKGELSGVVKEDDTFSVYQLVEIRKLKTEHIKRNARQAMEAKKKLSALNQLIEELEKTGRYNVEIVEEK